MRLNVKLIYGCIILLFLICSCSTRNDHSISNTQSVVTTITTHRPGSSNHDTLNISIYPIVVFYNPDSKELDSINLVSKPSDFQSQTHEFFYQMRNAKIVMKKEWPQLKQIMTNQHRFIVFKKESLKEVVDLNTFEDYSGMILWDGHKKPHKIDMMNVETELTYYFNK